MLEGARGRARLEQLERWTTVASPTGQAWLVDCDRERHGNWAGLNAWLESLLPAIEREAPDLAAQHDAELVAVLPALAERITPRFSPLTEAAPEHEQVRNYPADRAYRIGQGVIDLLTEWHARSGGGAWFVACDSFDRHGALVGRFFRELARRRGSVLPVSLLLAVEPGHGDAAAGLFAEVAPVRRVRMELAPDEDAPLAPAEARRRALEVEREVGTNRLEARLRLHELVRLWAGGEAPEREAAWRLVAVSTYNHLGYYEDALEHARALQGYLADHPDEAEPFGSSRYRVSSGIFYTLVATGRVEEAHTAALAELPHITDPESRSLALYDLAMLHARYLPQKDQTAAEKLLEQALEVLKEAEMEPARRHFRMVFVLNGLALVRHRQGRPGDALQLAQDGFAHLGEHLPPAQHRLHRSVLLYNAAQVYATGGALEEAVQGLAAAMEMDPDYSEYYNDRGNLLQRLGRLEEAVADYRRAIDRSPPYAEVWTNLGQCLARMDSLPGAVQAYSRALDLDPTRFLARVGRAQALAGSGQPEAAARDYDAAVELDAGHALVFANRAALRFGLGRIEEARHDLDRAIALQPGMAPLYRNRALALGTLGDAAAAAEDLETYLGLAPDAPDRAEAERELASLRALA